MAVSLDPLATTADLANRNITVGSDEATLVATFLAEASAAVREAAGCPITQTTSTIVLAGECRDRLPLPGLPIQSVDTVLIDGIEDSYWRLQRAQGALYRWGGWRWTLPGPSEVTVTYTHGLPECPEDIVGYVCVLVAGALRASRASADGTGIAPDLDVASIRIDDYSETAVANVDRRVTQFDIPDNVRVEIAARFGNGASVVRVY